MLSRYLFSTYGMMMTLKNQGDDDSDDGHDVT